VYVGLVQEKNGHLGSSPISGTFWQCLSSTSSSNACMGNDVSLSLKASILRIQFPLYHEWCRLSKRRWKCCIWKYMWHGEWWARRRSLIGPYWKWISWRKTLFPRFSTFKNTHHNINFYQNGLDSIRKQYRNTDQIEHQTVRDYEVPSEIWENMIIPNQMGGDIWVHIFISLVRNYLSRMCSDSLLRKQFLWIAIYYLLSMYPLEKR